MTGFTVHNGITGSRIGKALATRAKAESEALKLSRSLSHTLDIKHDGTLISWACRGEITTEVKTLEGC